jgi:hypothetical protein
MSLPFYLLLHLAGLRLRLASREWLAPAPRHSVSLTSVYHYEVHASGDRLGLLLRKIICD